MTREFLILLSLVLSSAVSISSITPVAVADEATIDAETEEVIVGDTDEDGDFPYDDEADISEGPIVE